MEFWKELPGYPNYAVSHLGNVKRLAHIAKHARYGDQRLKERLLTPNINHDGYERVNLKGKHRFVHVLVLEAFIGSAPEGMQACHNNGIPDDNRLENLRWDTPKANVADRKAHGTYQYGSKNHHAKLTPEQVIDIYTSSERSIDLANKYGVKDCTIANIKSGTNWSHITSGLHAKQHKVGSRWQVRVVDLS